jgi:hypothetical protein
MKHLYTLKLAASLAVHGSLAFAQQATLSLPDGALRIPSVAVGAEVYTDVLLRLGADGRFGLEAATPPGGQQGAAQTVQLSYLPQPNTQYWYSAQGRQVAVCSSLPQAGITLKIPAGATAQAKVPLVITLAGWAPSPGPNNTPSPVGQDMLGVEQFSAGGMAAAAVEYRGCDNWSSPLVARTNADESFDIASSDFGLALAAIKAAVAQRNLPVDVGRIMVAGTSFSSNLIYTVATKHGVQGAMALAGGCDYNCEATGTTYAQPNDFRVNGAAIRVAAVSGASDPLFPPQGLGSSGYGAQGARARIMGAIGDPARRPAAFYTHVEPAAGHEVTPAMWTKARMFAQCMLGVRPAADCAADNR